jgi:uncharacterized protein with von Willebrand factor type A (vWA) domain
MIGYSSYGKGRSSSKKTNYYGSNKGYSSYSYGGSWDYWGSYFSDPLENDDDLVVRDPENYTTPSKRDIEAKANIWRQSAVDQIKELARVCYFKMIGDKNYFIDEYADFENLADDVKEQLSAKKALYDSIYETFIPGFTPLDQAIAIYKQMSREAEKQDREDSDDVDQEMIQKAQLNFDREMYMDPSINEQLELNEHSKNRKMSIMNNISIIGELGTQFKVEKEIDEKIVSNSDIYAKKMMRDYAQIANIDLYQKLFPNFDVKLLTKDLVVNVPVDRKEQKQKIIILLDFSGSMDEQEKQDWVNAILIDRFKYVMRGEAEVFFSYFVCSPDQMHFQHIHDRETVIKFWQTFSNDPDGGTTRVGSMVEKVAADIKKKTLHNLDIDLSEEKPEILIINDGEDSIDSDKFPYKVNAICLMEQNNQLKNLCIATHGKQVHVDYDNNVVAYSESGEEIIN